MSVAKWVQLVIWSGGLIYISESPSVFIFSWKISAWHDIKNVSRRTSSPRGSRAPSQINMQINDIDFSLAGKCYFPSVSHWRTAWYSVKGSVSSYVSWRDSQDLSIADNATSFWKSLLYLNFRNAVKRFSLPKVIKWDRKSGDVLTLPWVKWSGTESSPRFPKREKGENGSIYF